MTSLSYGRIFCLESQKIDGTYQRYNKVKVLLRGVHTVVHEAILPRTFVRVRPSQLRTRTKVRVRVRVRRPPTMLDFLYVVHVYDEQMFELAVFR